MNTNVWSWALAMVLSVVLSTSCGQNGASFSGGTGTRQQPPAPVPEEEQKPQALYSQVTDRFLGAENRKTEKTDIVVVMDTSGSMDTEKTFLEKNMDGFIHDLIQMGIDDYQVFMVGTNFNFPDEVNANPHFSHLNVFVDSWNALDVITNMLKGDYAKLYQKELRLRPEAKTHFIVISDDNASTPTGIFKTQVKALSEFKLENIILHGLVGLPESNVTPTCTIAQYGKAYQELAVSLPNKGLVQDLCDDDWSALLSNLAGYIISKISTQKFSLTRPLEADESVEVRINGVVIRDENYAIDFATNELQFKAGREPRDGAVIEVTYTTKN